MTLVFVGSKMVIGSPPKEILGRARGADKWLRRSMQKGRD
jgi:hypothetical protein